MIFSPFFPLFFIGMNVDFKLKWHNKVRAETSTLMIYPVSLTTYPKVQKRRYLRYKKLDFINKNKNNPNLECSRSDLKAQSLTTDLQTEAMENPLKSRFNFLVVIKNVASRYLSWIGMKITPGYWITMNSHNWCPENWNNRIMKVQN